MKTKQYHLIILYSVFFSAYGTINAQSPDWLWAKQIGGTTNDAGWSIATDALENIYITGYFSGTVDFDPGTGVANLTSDFGTNDIFISKLDSSGELLWSKSIGGLGFDMGHSIAVDAFGNVYTTGNFTGTIDFDPDTGIHNLTALGIDIFISKLDPYGNFVWAKSMGSTNHQGGLSITLDASGNVYTTGFFQGIVDFDPDSIGNFNLVTSGYDDMFISKLDSSGNFIWAKRMGGIIYDWGYSIAVDLAGNVYTTGSFMATVDFDPGNGTYNLTSSGDFDIFISKLDSSGNFIWAKAISGTDYNLGYSIVIDTAGSGAVYTAGYFRGLADFDPDSSGIFNITSIGSLDVFISKLDSSGNFIWAKSIGGAGYEARGYSIVVDPAGSGDIFTTGYFSGTTDFDPDSSGSFNLTSIGSFDIFISRLNSSGNFVWTKAVGGTDIENGLSLAVDPSGQISVVGFFGSSTVPFGSTTLVNSDTSGGTWDIFIAKLDNTLTGMEIPGQTNGVSVYPNPITDKLTILLEINDHYEIILYDLASRKIMHQKFTGSVTLNTQHLDKGIYIYEIRNQKGVIKQGKVLKG